MTQSRSEQQRTLFNNSHVNAVGISYLVSIYWLIVPCSQFVRKQQYSSTICTWHITRNSKRCEATRHGKHFSNNCESSSTKINIPSPALLSKHFFIGQKSCMVLLFNNELFGMFASTLQIIYPPSVVLQAFNEKLLKKV